jgi:hypothetical protein
MHIITFVKLFPKCVDIIIIRHLVLVIYMHMYHQYYYENAINRVAATSPPRKQVEL